MILFCLFIVPSASNYAQEEAPIELPPMVAVTNNVLTMYGVCESPYSLMDNANLRLISSAWSLDGQFFAFSAYDDTFTLIQIWVVGRDCNAPQLITET